MMDRKFRVRNKASAKLDAKKVRDIRELYARSEATQGQLARDYGVTVITIGRIIRHESWQDVPDRDPLPSAAPSPDDIAKRALGIQRTVDGVNADAVLEELDNDKGDTLER